MAPLDTEALVVKAQSGDVCAFEELIRSSRKSINYIARTTLRNERDAEDAAQDALISMYENIGSLSAPKAFHAWMCQIVFRSCLRVQTKTKESVAQEVQEYDAVEQRYDMLPYEHLRKDERNKYLLEKIKELPDNYRQCLYLFYFEELSYKEIADALEINEKSVANQLSRAKQRLKELMEKDGSTVVAPSALLTTASMNEAFAFDVERVFSAGGDVFIDQTIQAVVGTGAGIVAVAASATASAAVVPLAVKVLVPLALIFAAFTGVVLVANPFELFQEPLVSDIAQAESEKQAVNRQETTTETVQEQEETDLAEDAEAPTEDVDEQAPSATDSSNSETQSVQSGQRIIVSNEPVITYSEGNVSIENSAYYEVVELEEGENPPAEEDFKGKAKPVTVTNQTKTKIVETTITHTQTESRPLTTVKTGDKLHAVVTLLAAVILSAASILLVTIFRRRRA